MEEIKGYTVKKVKDIKAGDKAAGYFFVKEAEVKTTTTNNMYTNFTLADNTGEINAKLWDYDPENANRYKAGKIVKCYGLVKDWQGQLQLNIAGISVVAGEEKDALVASDLIPQAPVPGEEMYDFIKRTAENMKNEQLKAVALKVLEDYKEPLLIYPAAKKNHHAIRSGLLYHTSTMLRMAAAFADTYDFLDRDLLFTGVIIHDIGKTEEMDITEYGLVSEYSNSGILLGHIIQGIKIIDRICRELGTDEEINMMLQHMILSHHYEPEFGSPKFPMFPEAEILHYLDIADARMYDMSHAKESTEPGKFSEKIKSLENRSIYRSLFEEGS